jgi:TPR repeat protein
MIGRKSSAGHRLTGGLSRAAFARLARLAVCNSCLLWIAGVSTGAQALVSPRAQQETDRRSSLGETEISQLHAKAEAGDAAAQTKLGLAYQQGNGVPQNDELAAKWFRKAADQGDASAENDLGVAYNMGRGVSQDKQEALRWYSKAAKQGSPQAMFNVGVSYYNGDAIGSNEYTAYAWFLLAQDAGNALAVDAVKRSGSTMSNVETSAAYAQIATMYEKGEELPKSEEQALRWLRKAAELDSPGKVRLAVYFLTGPDSQHDYAQALSLCRAAGDYPAAFACIGYIYRKGLGVPQNSVEAAKWYQKGVARTNAASMIAMAEMYSTGEGVKVDRPTALLLLVQLTRVGAIGAKQKASDLLQQISEAERKQVEKKLRDQRLDPKKVFAAFQAGP